MLRNQISQGAAISTAMNHYVAIRAHNRKIIQTGLARHRSIAERLKMMDLRVVMPQVAIDRLEIKTAARNFALQVAVSHGSCRTHFLVTKPSFTLVVPNQSHPLCAFHCR